MNFMRMQWFQNKKMLKLINVAQILIILGWLIFLTFFTEYKYRIVGLFFGDALLRLFGLPIPSAFDRPGHFINKIHIFFSLPIILLYRIWIYRKLNNGKEINIKNQQFGFISLSTILIIQILAQLLIFKKNYIIVDGTSFLFPIYITIPKYNPNSDILISAAICQVKILFITGGILYFAVILSIIKTVIIPYIKKKEKLKKKMNEILNEHENLITDLKK